MGRKRKKERPTKQGTRQACAGQATIDIQSYYARPARDAVPMAEMPFSPLQAMNCKNILKL